MGYQSEQDRRRPVRFKNISAHTMPPYGVGCLSIDRYSNDPGAGRESSAIGSKGDLLYFQVTRPNATHEVERNPCLWIVNGPASVPSGQFGFGFMEYPTTCLFSTEGLTGLGPGTTFNIKNGKWELHVAYGGPLCWLGSNALVRSEGANSRYIGGANSQHMAYGVFGVNRFPSQEHGGYRFSRLDTQDDEGTVAAGEYFTWSHVAGTDRAVYIEEGVDRNSRGSEAIYLPGPGNYYVSMHASIEATTTSVSDHDTILQASIMVNDSPVVFFTPGSNYYLNGSRKALINQDTGYLTAKSGREHIAPSGLVQFPSQLWDEETPIEELCQIKVKNTGTRPFIAYNAVLTVIRLSQDAFWYQTADASGAANGTSSGGGGTAPGSGGGGPDVITP
jgi:hypothetical protein